MVHATINQQHRLLHFHIRCHCKKFIFDVYSHSEVQVIIFHIYSYLLHMHSMCEKLHMQARVHIFGQQTTTLQ